MELRRLGPVGLWGAWLALLGLSCSDRSSNPSDVRDLETPLAFPPGEAAQVSVLGDLTVEMDAEYWVNMMPGSNYPFCFSVRLRLRNDSDQAIPDFRLDQVAIFSCEENMHLRTLDASPRSGTTEENLIPPHAEVNLQFGQAAQTWLHPDHLVGHQAYSRASIAFGGEVFLINGPSRVVDAPM